MQGWQRFLKLVVVLYPAHIRLITYYNRLKNLSAAVHWQTGACNQDFANKEGA